MFSLAYRQFIFLIFCFALGLNVNAEDSLFDDEIFFDESEQELDEWSDDSDIFGEDDSSIDKPFAWLNLGVSQKWGFNPASNYSTTKERTEITLGTSGSVSDLGYGEMEIKAT